MSVPESVGRAPGTSRSLIVTYYALDADYRARLDDVIGAATEQEVVSNVPAGGYLSVMRHFRNIAADTVYLPVRDKTIHSLVPALTVLCLMIRANRRVIVHPDFSMREFGFADAALSLVSVGAGFLRGVAEMARHWGRLARLQARPRVPVRPDTRDRALYLKTNLWLGVQAGGSVAHTLGVIGGMLNKGCAVDFVSMEQLPSMPESDDLEVIQVSPPRSYVVPRELHYCRSNQNVLNTVRNLQASRYGFIYHRLSLGSIVGVVLSRLWRCPLIIEYNGSETWLAVNWGRPLLFKKMVEKAEAVCLRHAHLIVTVSDVLRDQLIARGVEPERIVSHTNGVDPRKFDTRRFSAEQVARVRQSLGIPSDAVVVTFVGTFGQWHGVEILAESLRRMVETDIEWLSRSRIHVLFIGDGVKRSVVEETLSAPEIQPFYTITGLVAQEETPLYMAASDILVSPHVPNSDGSPFFGSPTKLFEYLATGRSVIASDLYQIGEVLKDCPDLDALAAGGSGPTEGQCGIRVTPGDSAELSQAIKFLIDNAEWRRAAGKKARQLAVSRYTWDHHVDAISQGLQRVLALDAARETGRVRLLINGLHSKSGGGVTYLRNLLPLLAREEDFDVHLVIHRDQEEYLPSDIENVTLHTVSFNPGFWNLLVREQVDVVRLARKIGTDVTFSPANYGPLLAPNPVIMLRNALGVAFVERRPVKIAYWAMLSLGTALSLLRCRRAIAVSDYARRTTASGLLGFLRHRVTVIPHGVGAVFSPGDGNGDGESGGFLLAVSDIYVQKNLENLIAAFSRLHTRHPDLVLKIAGRPIDAEYFSRLKEVVARQGLAGKVEFLGQVSPKDLVHLYRACTVFVFPSTVETFGNPLVEAMACGAAIACSNTAAMPEVAENAALFFNPLDVGDMASAIEKLLGNETLRRTFSERARVRAGDFSWNETAAQTLEVIKGMAWDRRNYRDAADGDTVQGTR